MKIIARIAVLCILLILQHTAIGQILSIDKPDTLDYDKKAKTSVNFSVGLEIDKQQTTLYDATNTADFLWQKNHELLIASASDRFTYNGPSDILNAGFVHLRFRHNYKDKWQPETYTQYQWDNKRGLEERVLGGVNLRYNLLKGHVLEMNAAAGPMFEHEKWNYNGVDSTKIPADHNPVVNDLIKLNSYIRFDWKPAANNDITVKVYLQTRFDRFQPRIAPLFNWNVDTGKHTAFSFAFSGLYDARPVVPIGKFYYNISNSIVLKW